MWPWLSNSLSFSLCHLSYVTLHKISPSFIKSAKSHRHHISLVHISFYNTILRFFELFVKIKHFFSPNMDAGGHFNSIKFKNKIQHVFFFIFEFLIRGICDVIENGTWIKLWTYVNLVNYKNTARKPLHFFFLRFF